MIEKCHEITLICNTVDRLTKTKCNDIRPDAPEMTENIIKVKGKK